MAQLSGSKQDTVGRIHHIVHDKHSSFGMGKSRRRQKRGIVDQIVPGKDI
jgi:hypothetical protein